MTQVATATAATPLPAAAVTPVQGPSQHMRVLLTFFAIFPLVTIGSLSLRPFSESWHPVLGTFVTTLFVVPLASYLVIPSLFKLHGRITRRLRRS